MAVYTEVSEEALAGFLREYDIGELQFYRGIAEGVSNSNFLLQTSRGLYILTLFEHRFEEADLPFFIELMEFLHSRGVPCPVPIRRRAGQALGRLADRPAVLVSFLKGMSVKRPKVQHCAELGRALAHLHLAGREFPHSRANAWSVDGWQQMLAETGDWLDEIRPGLYQNLTGELDVLRARWPKHTGSEQGGPEQLERGIIHADLFPDNVFFSGDKLSGLIDYYFACTDFLAYDLAICLNAWCFEPDHAFNITKGRALLRAYQAVRPLSPAELDALPILARGASMRFLLTRAHDWLNTQDDALVKLLDPLEYWRKLEFHRTITSARGYGAICQPA